MKKTLLIIKAQPQSLGTVEGFLRNREWKIKSTSNLKEALIFLVQEQPQFVMVCIDHPNRKVRNLPKILTQAFPVCVIAFTEESSAASFNLLSNSSTEYLVYPPVTGPAVERTVNKYLKDLHAKGLTSPPRGGLNAVDNGVISIKGEGGSFSSHDAQSILAHMLSNDENSAYLASSANTSQPGMAAHGLGAGTLHSAMLANATVDPLATRQNQARAPMMGWTPLPSALNKKQPLTPEQIEQEPRATKKDSIILRGTKEALEKACVKPPLQPTTFIEEATNVACIVIQSARFSGYLITAMSKNKKIDSVFMDKVRERLFRFLKENGENVTDGEKMDLQIKQVPFEDWALDCAEFLRKSVHEGQEVAMAFFPRQDIEVRLADSPAEEMAAIKIEELAGDVAVEFNVYIHLPRNNRYVLYTPRGSVFYHVQKDRLLSQGISQLHILKGDLRDLDKYRAQNFLNEKIQEFEEKLGSKEPA
ncbi:hypothetical protein [Bdellovibrio bacteriovorus]|uniref:hypothetical protein n=1 Tax=Bdellovibrio bacteriovorus TaxID=959 RepID=UPI0035A6E24A